MDDGAQKDLREEFLYQHLFITLNQKGIQWEVAFGQRKGQVVSHNLSIKRAKELGMDYIWRIDDDCVPEPDVLEKCYKHMTKGVGAVGGTVLVPSPVIHFAPSITRENKMENVLIMMNSQWFKQRSPDPFDVEHLCGIFLYRVAAADHGYNEKLSAVGHTEETQFTYEMFRKGWRLVVDPTAETWHYRAPSGGIRSYTDHSMYQRDFDIFQEKLKEWGVKPRKFKVIVLDNGIGDHCCFLSVYDEIRRRCPDHTFVIAPCWTEVFEAFADRLKGDEVIIHLDEGRLISNAKDQNVYAYMSDNQFDLKGKTMAEAFVEMYTK
jgi:hypothetical protein